MDIKKRFELTSETFGSNWDATTSEVSRFLKMKTLTAFTKKGFDSLSNEVENLEIGGSFSHHTYDGGAVKITRLENF